LVQLLDVLRQAGDLAGGVISHLGESSLQLLCLLLGDFPLVLKLADLLFIDVGLLGGLCLESLNNLHLCLFRLSLYGLILLTELIQLFYQPFNLLLHLYQSPFQLLVFSTERSCLMRL
jgi:hypothetical protein